MSETEQNQANKKLIVRLVGIVGGMFLFAFALVPLYDVFCEITGINGKTRGKAIYQSVEVNKQREVTVEFITDINRGMPWEFKSLVKSIKVHPGELNEVKFYAKNTSRKDIIGQTVPSISPGEGALYLNKTECFCFDQQRLAAGEEVEMPMKFYVDSEIPDDITHLTLSYKLFNVTDAVEVASGATK
ncbi:cytochrome c oxidase assembly protein [Aliikangiella coralliicola]|uniref:Cytochrome c oxidase assembly protein CtaG n=1 Tax=Aliikangiella coralliicola TaxID=2592383 RepID=A0A545UHB1_9GAMM|nr:cytochrome c oxidase assembly protein [Aliikangiella coralliicola]TQV88803.1 cytochrome c oxidase assembly protein [Aliikangiella coralliicola]